MIFAALPISHPLFRHLRARRGQAGPTRRWTDNPSSLGCSESEGFDFNVWFGIVLGFRFGVCQLGVLRLHFSNGHDSVGPLFERMRFLCPLDGISRRLPRLERESTSWRVVAGRVAFVTCKPAHAALRVRQSNAERTWLSLREAARITVVGRVAVEVA